MRGRLFSAVFVDLRPTFRPSRSLILDIKLCFTDEGLNSNAAWFGTWQTLLPDTNGKLNGMLVNYSLSNDGGRADKCSSRLNSSFF